MLGVEISPSAGNTLQCLQSGLFAQPGEVTVEDTNTVDSTISGAGDTDDPYIISSEVLIAPDGDCGAGNFLTEVTPGGLCVPLSEDANNQVVIGTDGGIYAAPATVDGAAGCGIEINGGIISVRSLGPGDWPYPCDISEGLPVYCDANGDLRTAPDHVPFQFFEPRGSFIADGTVIAPGERVCQPTNTTFTVDNTNGCRDLVIHLQFGLDYGVDLDPGAQADLEYVRSIDGVPAGPIEVRRTLRNDGLTPMSISDDMERDFFNVVVAAGTSMVYEAGTCIENVGTAPMTANRDMGASIRAWGGTS